jgi:hypothetical protein
MKMKLTVGAAMLLTLGSALAGGLILHKETPSASSSFTPPSTSGGTHEVTPEMIAKWKVTAATADHTPPMLPI